MKTMVSALLISILFCTAGVAQEDFKYKTQIDALVQPYLEHEKFRCASVGVLVDGKVWVLNYGHLSGADSSKPDGDTIYEIGSISKVFTSVLLADAIGHDTVNLDTTLGDLIEKLQESNPEVAESVTLQHLSQHMSGLPRMPTNIKPRDPNNPFADYDTEMLIEYLKTAKLKSKPGAKSQYSNLAAGLLGDLLAVEAESSYEELLALRILQPLKMNDTALELSESQKSRLAPPHNSSLIEDHNWDFDALAGAGAIRSSVNDMMRFVQANINRPNDDTGEALALAWKEQLTSGNGHMAMGLGWMIAGDGSTRWHNGQTGGYHSMLLISRKLNAGVVFLSNTAGSDTDALAQSIFRTAVGMKVKPRKFKKGVDVNKSIIKRLVGNYQLAPGVVISITAEGEKMMVQLTGQSALGITAESETIWNLNDVVAQLRFDLPKKGPASNVTLHQNGQIMPAPRIADD